MMNNVPDNISFSLDSLQAFIDSDYSRIGILVDENTRKLCYPLVSDMLPNHFVFEIKSGERHKTLDTCREIWNQLTVQGFDRHSLLINLGGGVIGDMGGFCAATFKRGIDFINLPTTLLSQVDASVGGKLGIDFMGLKNHIGIFRDPQHIFIHSGFLQSLPDNELISGFAEVIKHHLIRDKDGWHTLRKTQLKNLDWNSVIPHSVKIKSEVVAADPFEKGERKILNLGHTVGHAIESFLLSSDQPVLHGEAVAAGIICENHIAVKKGMLSTIDDSDISHFILSRFGKIDLPENCGDEIVKQAYQDKKNQEKKIRAVLLTEIGQPKWDVEITGAEILDAIDYYRNLQI